MLYIQRRTYLIAAAVLLLLLAAFLLPVEMPRSIKARGTVAFAREWALLRNDNGQIVSLLRDNRAGSVQHCSMMQVQRGDAMSFKLSDNLRDGLVTQGDTVGYILSHALLQQITSLEGELAIAEASLLAARSGEKVSLVDEARQHLALAQAALHEQEQLHARQVELYARELISDETYELSANRRQQLRIAADIADAALRSALTGLKPEQIRASEAQVEALRDRLEQYRQLMRQHTFIAPVSGMQRPSWAVDTLLIIGDMTELLLIVPIELADLEKLSPGSRVTFTIPTTQLQGSAVVEYIDRNVRYFGRRAVVSIIARIDQADALVGSGMLAECKVHIQPGRLSAWISETLATILR
jgi:hypothetical protein